MTTNKHLFILCDVYLPHQHFIRSFLSYCTSCVMRRAFLVRQQISSRLWYQC